jgi:predicted Zn-dependent protease
MGTPRQQFEAPLTADRAVEAVSQAVRACDADAVEVTLLGRAGEFTRFAGDRIHQPQDITELSVSVKAIVDGHSARAATSSLDRLAETATYAAALAAGRAKTAAGPGHAQVGVPSDAPELNIWHDDTAAFDVGERVQLVGQAIRSASQMGGRAAGMIGRAVTQIAVANSNGVLRHAAATEASGSLTITIDDGTAHWVDLHRSANALSAGASIERAVERAHRSKGRIALPDGQYTVVLGPQAVGELLGFLQDFGFSGDLAAAEVGLCANHAGQRLTSGLVTIADDALATVGLPIPFDFEGTAKRKVPFLTEGVVGEPVTDLATAAALGGASTGHAHIAREQVPAPVAANVVMQTGPQSEDDLIADVEKGVYIERFWYTRLVDRQASTITGVSRDACFLIENGRMTQPVATARFTQSVLGFLATVDGVGNEARSQPVMNVWNGCISAPAIRGSGFRFGNRPVEQERA